MSDDIIIIGGGVIGLTLAWRLLEAGARVRLIDAGARRPSATWAAAGMLAPSFERGGGLIAEPLYRLCAASLARWASFARELETASGLSIDYRPYGILGLAFDEAGANALEESYDDLSVRGADVEWIDGDRARKLEPAISPGALAALHAPTDGQVDARLLAIALRQVVERLGGALVDDAAVRIVSHGGEVSAVETLGGATIAGSRVVLAAGAAVGSIAMAAPAPPVFCIKGEAVALSMRVPLMRRVVRAPGAYLCPKADGRLVIGATEVPQDESLEPSPAAIDALKAGAAHAAPAAASLSEQERWAGLRPATPDGAPILGADPRGPAGLFLALGHYRNGVLLAPETAALLAPLILDGVGAAEIAAFRPDRFNL